MSNKKFPIQIFPDINEDAFDKFQKKNVSEDYVAENLEYVGWQVYTPFVDTGMDLIATKVINGKTVTRFIQVKTRALKDNAFGYTLKPKDFRDDPRHVFLLYSDSTNDFFILPMYDYLKFFYDNRSYGESHFSSKSFRVENNKMNSLKYKPDENKFYYSKASFEPYRNEKGLELIENDYIEEHFDELANSIREMKKELFYTYKDIWLGTNVRKNDDEKTISEKEALRDAVIAQLDVVLSESEEQRMERFSRVEKQFRSSDPELFKTHKEKYIY